MTKARPVRLATNLALPIEAVTETFAILAKRGAGKTYTASVFAEELLKAQMMVVVLDPIGVWWGLRSSADGKSPGMAITILGGDHGDIPLEHTGGAVIADLVVEERIPVVVDLSAFRKGEQRRFVTDFAERLYHRNREALHLIIDEADAFAPQRPMKDQARMLGAVEDLVRRGRARGIGVTLVTQRSAVLNKDVLTQAEVLVALRTIAPQDRGAIDEWVKVHGDPERRKDLMDSLPSLPVGTAWVWSPGWLDIFRRVKIRARETFDSSSTPKVGKGKRARTPTLATVDLDELRERMAETIERAKADDPRELRRTIAALQRDLTAERRTKAKPEPVEVERVVEIEVPVLNDGQVSALETAIGDLRGLVDNLAKALNTAVATRNRPVQRPVVPAPAAAVRRRRPPPPKPPAAGERDVEGLSLRKGERKMLDVLARHQDFRVTRAQLGTLAGYAASGGTFGTYLGVLRRHGLIDVEDSGIITITDAGLDVLGLDIPPPPQTTDEVLEQWRRALRLGERKMLDALVEAYPAAITRDDLAEQTGYEVTGGTFGTYLGVLRRNGLIEADGATVRAADTLFLLGADA